MKVLRANRRDLFKIGLLISSCKSVNSTKSVALSEQVGPLVTASEVRDSGKLLHNLRYENIPVTSSVLESSRDFRQDPEIVKAHVLDVLNSGQFAGLRVRGGGHSYIGASVARDAYTLDMSPFRQVEADPSRNTVKVGAGCRFYQVSAFLNKLGPGIFLPTGDCPTVGVAGYFTGGGLSLLSPLLGFGVDRVQSATLLVFSRPSNKFEARTLTVSPNEHPELFWAMMGGGGNFGILTDLTLKYEVIQDAVVYRANFTAENDESFK